MSKRILVIEDEPALLRAIGEALTMDGFQAMTAVDAEQGMALLRDARPNLILLDLILPGKNGFEVLKELKASPEYSKIPVIILSNLGDEEEIQQGLKLGAANFLIKADYDLAGIVGIVKKYLK
ncbi:MAG: response regulator [Patescibacteria group bacterium]